MTARRSPFDLVTADVPSAVATKAELLQHSRDLEREALERMHVAVAVACLQDVRFLTPSTLGVYAELARRGAEVLILGRGLHASLAPGVRGVDLADDDPLGDEWTVLLAGRTFTCFAAQDLEEPAAQDADRTFAWAQTDSSSVVAEIYDVLAGDLRRRPGSGRLPPYPEDEGEGEGEQPARQERSSAR